MANSDEATFVAAGDDDALRLPDGHDLSASLRFFPRDGRIVLGDERMVLLHVQALAELRRELIDTFGSERARAMLVRVGYASGARDAQYAQKLRGDRSAYELLAAGPQLHALEGMAHVTPIEVRFDIERGHYHGEFVWKNSAEVDAHLRVFGSSSEPVCWTLIGYASGYTSVFMGRPIIYRELACRACGSRRCRLLGKPLPAWDRVPPEFAFLSGETLAPSDPAKTSWLPPAPDAEAIVGVSSAFRSLWSQLSRVAPTTTPVLLCGETGTGKDTLARAVHSQSRHAAGPLVKVIAAATDVETLVAKMHDATSGTLLVDDVEALASSTRATLVAALDNTPTWRLICTSRRDLTDALAESSPAIDPALLHRIAVFPVHIPPLRDRKDDLPPLMRRFLDHHSSRHDKRVSGFTERAAAALMDHDYPGNLRELSNLIERAVVLVASTAAIDEGHLFGGRERPASGLRLGRDGTLAPAPPPPSAAPSAGEDPPDDAWVDRLLDAKTSLDALESALIRRAVARADGNLSAAARLLGLTRPQLAYRFRREGD